MPVIPTYNRQVSIPGGGANALGNIGSAGVVGEALAKSGNQITEASQQIAASSKRMQEENDKLARINLDTDYSKILSAYELKQKSDNTGEKALGITQRSMSDIDIMAQEFLKNNVPENLQESMAPILKARNSQLDEKFVTFELGERNVYKKQTINNTYNFSAQQIAQNADSSIDVTNIIGQNTAKLESMNVPQYEIDKQNAWLVSTAVETNVNNGNLKEAEELINEHKKLLDVHGNRDTLINMITAKKKQAEISAKEAEEEAIRLRNKEFQTKYLDGKLKLGEVMSSNLPGPEKKEWINQLNDIPVSFKTDKEFELNLWEKIMTNPESVDELGIMKFAGHGLSMEDAKGLIAVRDKQLNGDPERKEAIKSVLSELKLDKVNGVFGNKEYFNQIGTFKKWIKAHPQEPPESYRERILSPRKMTKVEEWLDWIPFVNPGEANPRETRKEIEAELVTTKEGQGGKRMPFKTAMSTYFGADANLANSVMQAESSGDPMVTNKNTNGTMDYGLFQINSTWIPELKRNGIIKSENDLFDVGKNILAAKYIYDKAGGTFDRDWKASKSKWGNSGKIGIDEWLNMARKANKGVSDDELIAYYKGKYK